MVFFLVTIMHWIPDVPKIIGDQLEKENLITQRAIWEAKPEMKTTNSQIIFQDILDRNETPPLATLPSPSHSISRTSQRPPPPITVTSPSLQSMQQQSDTSSSSCIIAINALHLEMGERKEHLAEEEEEENIREEGEKEKDAAQKESLLVTSSSSSSHQSLAEMPSNPVY